MRALQARGFGRNRMRHLELTVSRGTEGELARLRAHEATLQEKLDELEQQPFHRKTHERFLAMARRVYQARQKRESFEANAARKNARVEGGGERLGKWLHMMVHNALLLALAGSPDEAARAMSPETVFELLLGRPALTRIEDGRLTMWVDALEGADDQRRQEAVVACFNKLGLRCRGKEIVVHLHGRPADKAA